jgi:hypothetical protein
MGHIERPRRVVRPDGAAQPAQELRTGRRLTTGTAQRRTTGTGGAGAGGLRTGLYDPRSERLRQSVGRLDAGLDENACRQLAEWAREEYRTAHGDVPLGFVARCYLGPPFVDHQLNLFHVIVQHFAPTDPMPEPFSQARMLARSGSYAYVEVYSSGLVLPVLEDGTVVRP